MTYTEKKFALPALQDISPESVEAHLGLYAGYVKNFNALTLAQTELMQDSEKNALALSEITRRLAFEFDGMRLHELYFAQWEGGALPPSGTLVEALTKQFGSVEAWQKQFVGVGMMRGPGWALLYYDKEAGVFHNAFVGEQHQGHFATLPIVLALDVWEHAYLAQYGTTGKKQYIDAFFKNLNWNVCDDRLKKILS